MKRHRIEPQIPPNPAPHVIDWLGQLGFTEAGGMGAVPLSWREIAEWQRLTGVPLSPFEAKLLRNLSSAYLSESRKAEDENCPPPFGYDSLEEARVRASFRAMRD